MPCLAVLEIHDFVTGRMDLGSVARVDEHLDACEICREIVASASTALSGDSDNPGSSAQFLMPPGTLLDRFAIEEVIGRGAMGVVYAAHDPRLDRRVALKLLRADRRSGISSSELIAEAQSMAQLAHPNVVAVYDVGPVAAGEDEFYVAMELVEGVNLRDWIDAKRRPWLEVVTLMSAAGQGLCAAHAAGVCHRDVKPDNIIVGNDGRARVTDFGLARARGGDLRTDDVGELQVTVTALSGTPAYMAPELFSGEPASPASDQYSFCISLFEALYGVRPFPAHSLDELLASASQGRISWPKRSQVPHKIERVLQRGLQPLPENRYPSMVELLAALSSATKSKKRLITVAALSAASAAAVASFAAMSLGAHRESACRDATANIDSAWNPAERDGLAAVLSKSSSELSDKTLAALDRFASNWSSMRLDSCRATHERSEQSAELLDLRTRCLDRRLGEMLALKEQLRTAPVSALVDAPMRADALGDLHLCSNLDALRAAVPLPEDPKVREQISGMQSEMDRVAAMLDTSKASEAIEQAEDLVERARSLAYAPLTGEALQLLGGAWLDAQELDKAELALGEALHIAASAADHRRVADLSITRVMLVGMRQQKFEAAIALVSAAEVAVGQAGNDPVQVARLHMNAGAVYDMAGKREQAETELLAGLQAFRGMPEGKTEEIASSLHNLAALALDAGDRALAKERFEESLALRESFFGKSHPSVAQSCLGLGALARRNNELPLARSYYQRAEAIYRQVFGEDYAALGAVHNNLAIVFMSEKDYAHAVEQHERALAIRSAQYGVDHPLVAQSYSGLGNALLALGRVDEALQYHEKSVALRRKAYPPEHPSIAIGLHGLAGALSGEGEFQKAIDTRGEAIAIVLKAGADAADVAEMEFAQARDLWQLPGEKGRSQALDLARSAQAGYESAGESSAAELAEVAAWLTSHSKG